MLYFSQLFKLIPVYTIYTDRLFVYSLDINYKHLIIVLNFLKKHQNVRLNVLSTISCTDYPELTNRFKVTYTLMSIDFPIIIHVNTQISEYNRLLSCSNLFRDALWLEREVWDMFGVFLKIT